MSTGRKLLLADADRAVAKVRDQLSPLVKRIEVVGSVRRRQTRVGDIEFLAEPFLEEGLFEQGAPIVEPVKSALLTIGTWSRGGDRMMQITDAFGLTDFKVEVYIQHAPATWGVLHAVRTGPWELGHYLMTVLKERSYRVQRGHVLTRSGELVPTETEEQFFALADVECKPPNERDAQQIALWNDLNRYKNRSAS